MRSLNDVVLIANNDWDGFWYQRQEFSVRFAQIGHRVWYLNRTLQRWPSWTHVRQRLRTGDSGPTQNMVPAGITVISPCWLPPLRALRPINRLLIRRTFCSRGIHNPIVIAYNPSFNTIDAIDWLSPSLVAYVNVHNYDADNVMPDLLLSERELIMRCDALFADSDFNLNRLKKFLPTGNVHYSPPGVIFQRFRAAWRGDEVARKTTIGFFGGIGVHMDMALYQALSGSYRIRFIGSLSSEMAQFSEPRIEIRPPVPNELLPVELRDVDALAIFYRSSAYVDGVIPAKIFECLATGKPLLVSGFQLPDELRDVCYDVHGSPKMAMETMRRLDVSESPSVLNKRFVLAEGADWSNRFSAVYAILMAKLRQKSQNPL